MPGTVQISSYRAPQPPDCPLFSKENPYTKIFHRVQDFLFFPLNKIVTCAVLPSSIPNLFPKYIADRIPPIQKLFQKLTRCREHAISIGGQEVQFDTHDEAKIKGLFFPGSQRKAILYVGGNGEFCEFSYQSMLTLKRNVGDVNLFLFNPRNVGLSKGSPNGKNMATDAYSAFKYLIDVKGFDPNDVVVYGLSLGGGYGVEGAALIQQEYPDKRINFISHNSFKDLKTEVSDIAQYRVLPNWKWLHRLVVPVLKAILSATRWHMNSIEAIRSLKGKKLIIFNKKDEVVSCRASLYKGLKEAGHISNTARLKMSVGDTSEMEHMRQFNEWESFEVTNRIKEMFGMPFETSLDPHQMRLSTAASPASWNKKHLHMLDVIDKQFQKLDHLPAPVLADSTSLFDKLLGSSFNCLGRFIKHRRAFVSNRSIDVSPQDLVRVLNRTKIDVLLDQLTKALFEPRSEQIIASTLRQLEGVRFEEQDNHGTMHNNIASHLYGIMYEQARENSQLSAIVEQNEFGRQAFQGAYPQITAEMKKQVVIALKTQLERL